MTSGREEPQGAEGGEPDDRQPAGVRSPDDLREATFSPSPRGYDPKAVHAFLEEVAAWIDDESKFAGAPGLEKESAEPNERTSNVLLAAEEAVEKLRVEARRDSERVRANAEEGARKVELRAQARADEILAEAAVSAERMIEAAEQQRRSVEQERADLLARRDELTADALQLADDLAATIDAMRSLDSLERRQGGESRASAATSSPDRLLLDDDGPESAAERDRRARARLASAPPEGLSRIPTRDRGEAHDTGSDG